MNDLHSRATAYLNRAVRIISKDVRDADALILRYVRGERLDDAGSQHQLLRSLEASRTARAYSQFRG